MSIKYRYLCFSITEEIRHLAHCTAAGGVSVQRGPQYPLRLTGHTERELPLLENVNGAIANMQRNNRRGSTVSGSPGTKVKAWIESEYWL